MILIDAVFIHTGGGKTLLDYLISELNSADTPVFYLLDERYKPQIPVNAIDKKMFISGFFNRCQFYNKNGNKFSKVFCLGNIPPHKSLKKAEVIMYLHSASYLEPVIHTTMKQRIIQYLKRWVFRTLIKNSNLWMVQTGYMKKLFQEKYVVSEDIIKILPFFKTIGSESKYNIKEKNSFFYPGTAEPHKNHKRLIDAFCMFYDKHKKGNLYLTVEERFKDVFDYIESKKLRYYPIYNLGYISDKKNMRKVYSKSEFLIFPSLMESFGLPLIEATEFNCKIVASKLDYVTQVCIPSYTFDPYDIHNMSKAFEYVIQNDNLELSYAIIHDTMNQIINHIIK